MATKRYKRDFKAARSPAATRNADAGTRGVAGRGRTHLRGEPANGVELGAHAGGRCAGVAAQAAGPAGSFRCEQRAQLGKLLRRGDASGFPTEMWTLSACGQADRTRVWASFSIAQCVAAAARSGLFQPAPGRPCHPARRAGDLDVEEKALAGAKKNCQREGRTIVFVDESGLSERPTRVRPGRPKVKRRCCSTASTGSSCL